MKRQLLIGLMLGLLVSGTMGQSQREPVEFEGLIQRGPVYRAQILYDKETGWRTVVKLRVPYHHAARIEWVNLKEHTALDKPANGARRKHVLFEMESREVVKVPGQERWNTTYRCRIIAVE